MKEYTITPGVKLVLDEDCPLCTTHLTIIDDLRTQVRYYEGFVDKVNEFLRTSNDKLTQFDSGANWARKKLGQILLEYKENSAL
jgi:hypothetical protein